MRKKQSPSPLLSFLTFIFLLTTVLGLFIIGVSVIILQQQTSIMLGSADDSLSVIEKAYLTTLLMVKSDELAEAADPLGKPSVFKIHNGENAKEITNRLFDRGYIINKDVFQSYLIYTGWDKKLRAGEHWISPSMSTIEIADMLHDSENLIITFQILPGWRKEEISSALESSGLIESTDDFLHATEISPNLINPNINAPMDATLEGFLFPGTYKLRKSSSSQELITDFTRNFSGSLSSRLLDGFQAQGLTIYEAVTLASILQREAIIKDEMPIIASVFLNRLHADMKLDTDPTIQYLLGFNSKQKTWWTNPLSYEDIKIDSPYNTYIYPGLPPSPISNPGLDALNAVAFPAQTTFFYFRASCNKDGRHNFSNTYEEHLLNDCP